VTAARPTLALALLLLASADASAAAFDVEAHQGGGEGVAPPETLAAYRHAVEVGATTLELDAQVTGDGVLVVHHDQVLDRRGCRRTDGGQLSSRVLRELDWDEVALVECTPGHGLARVADVLRLARRASRPVHANVEIKLQDAARGAPLPEFARLLVAVIAQEDMLDRTLVQSFRPEALREVARIAPSLPTSILVRDRRDYQRLVDESGARVLSPRRDDLRRDDVETFHAQGVAVIPWTVDDPAEMKRFAGWGVDGLITNRPTLALEVLGLAPAPIPEAKP